jgi:hypothetical protein
MDDATATSSSNHTKFDLEHFSLFLSANLVGGRMEMEKRLAASIASLPPPPSAKVPQSVSFPVYGRSPVLHHVDAASSFWQDSNHSPHDAKTDSTTTTTTTTTIEKAELYLLFLDATVVFRTGLQENKHHDNKEEDQISSEEKKPQSTASLSFGAFLRRRRNDDDNDTTQQDDFFYLQGAEVTTSFLSDHVDQCGYVLLDTPARFIAKSTFRAAFRRLEPGTMVEEDVSSDEASLGSKQLLHKIKIPLVYQDDDDDDDSHRKPCYLEITNRNGPVHPLTQHVAATMLLGGIPNNYQGTEGILNNRDDSRKAEGVSSSCSDINTVSKEDTKQLLVQYEEWKKNTGTWLLQCQQEAARSAHDAGSSPSKQATQQLAKLTKAAVSPKKQKATNNNSDNHVKKTKNRPMYGVQRIGGGKKKKRKIVDF